MSVENHRHCQATVLAANGISGQGATWNLISSLNLQNLKPDNWKSLFEENNNITGDFKSTLEIIDQSVEKVNGDITNIDNSIANINNSIANIQGQLGLNSGVVRCFIAPKAEYFDAHSGIYSPQTDEDGRRYYTLTSSYNNRNSYLAPNNRIYPGDDNNLENQYKASGNNKMKYPMFTVETACEYLRRFRANGSISYIIRPQLGDYKYGTNGQNVRLVDAQGGSSLVISPELPDEKQRILYGNIVNATSDPYIKDGFQDTDMVKVRFIWSDNEEDQSKWYSSWVDGMIFSDSTISVINCGFLVERERNATTGTYANKWEYSGQGPSFLAIAFKSGKVTFKGCVFRNVYMISSTAQNPLVAFQMEQLADSNSILAARVSGGSGSDSYNLDNLYRWYLPCVFYDDPEPTKNPNWSDQKKASFDSSPKTIGARYINLDAGDGAKVMFDNSYVVFKWSRKLDSPIGIKAGDTMHMSMSWQTPSKIVFCEDHENFKKIHSTSGSGASAITTYDPNIFSFIRNEDLSQITRTRGTVSDQATNQELWQQARIEIITHSNSEYNLGKPQNVFLHTANNGDSTYDYQYGIYNFLAYLFGKNTGDRSYKCITWNNKVWNPDNSSWRKWNSSTGEYILE